MYKLSFKVALPVILAGLFSIVVFIALSPDGLDPSFYIVLFLLSVFIFFYGLRVGQTVSAPVEKILRKAVDLSKGDTKARFYLETKDEFGELSQIFNKIADDLESSKLKAEDSEKDVGIKVKAKTQDLEETIRALEQKVKNRTIEIEKLMKQQELVGPVTAETSAITEIPTKVKTTRASKKVDINIIKDIEEDKGQV